MSKLILKSSFVVLILIILGKILSFGRDIFISYEFGSGLKTDAYFAANNVPSILFTALISSYIILLTPIYKKIEIHQGRLKADLFVSKLLNATIIATILISSLGFFLIDFFIDLVAPGFNTETRDLAVYLGRILVLSFPFSAVTTLLATISTANGKFYASHIIPIFSSLFVILGVWLFAGKYDIFSIAYAGVIAFGFQLFVQILISKSHFNYTLIFNIKDKNLKAMTIAVIPVFLGFSIDQINLLVNSILSSSLETGSLSVLNYAQRLQGTITGTITTAVLTVIYPLMSRLSAENSYRELVTLSKKTLKYVSLIFIPIIAFIAFNSVSLIKIVYYRGSFDLDAVNKTSDVFIFYAVNVFFLSIREICLRLYYIKDNTRIPFVSSLLSMIINAFLGYILIKQMGVAGLSLANLIATIISLIFIYFLLNKSTNIELKIYSVFKFFTGLFYPTITILILLYWQKKYIILNNPLLFLIGFLIILIIFCFLLIIFRQRDMTNLFKLFKEKYIKNGTYK